MSPDPSSLHFSRLTNSQTFNRYAFVTNDPLKYTDAYGLVRCYECGDGGDYGNDGFDDEFGGGGGGGGGGYQFDDGSDDGGGYNGADPGADAGDGTDLSIPVVVPPPDDPNTTVNVTTDPNPPVDTTPSSPSDTTIDPGCDPNFCVNVNAGPNPTLPFDPGIPGDPTISTLPSDPYPIRLFGTHWCGPGGEGPTVNALDAACKAHDQCYDSNGLTILSNFNPFQPSDKIQALQACNQNLCDTASSLSDLGSGRVVIYFQQIPVVGACKIH